MAENLANDVQTTLNGAITNVATAITVSGSTGMPAANFRVRVDNEIMLVTSIGGGTNWTVTRAKEGTTGVAHADGSYVVHVLTEEGLRQWLADRFAPLTASMGADVALNNVANFFDGPSVAQGTVGTFLAFGSVTVTDSGAAAIIQVKLWDGTTVIASGRAFISAAAQSEVVHLSGILTNPAANIRISARDASNTTGNMFFNATGTSKDGTLTVIRIA